MVSPLLSLIYHVEPFSSSLFFAPVFIIGSIDFFKWFDVHIHNKKNHNLELFVLRKELNKWLGSAAWLLEDFTWALALVKITRLFNHQGAGATTLAISTPGIFQFMEPQIFNYLYLHFQPSIYDDKTHPNLCFDHTLTV